MRFILEVMSEPDVGKKLWLRARQSADVGRGDHAVFVIPHDQQLSALHFHIECDDRQCRLRDLNSRNGTTVNGRKVVRAILQDGDTIVAGSTSFRVHISGAVSPDSADDAAGKIEETQVARLASGWEHRVGHWVCAVLPEGWEIIPEKGMQNTAADEFTTSLVLTESEIAQDVSIQEHIETLIEKYLEAIPVCRTDGATEAEVPGAEEARQFLLEFPQQGDIALRQRYLCVRQGTSFGLSVLTTSKSELERSGALLDQIFAGLAWQQQDD